MRTKSFGGFAKRSRVALTSLAAAAAVASLAFVGAGTAVAQDCPNAEFRTGASKYLPDCRAYEQVSAIDKRGVGTGAGTPNFDSGYWVSGDGQNAWYGVAAAFAGAQTLPMVAPYFTTRDEAGWNVSAVGWMGAKAGGFAAPDATMPDPHGVSRYGGRSVHVSDRDPNTDQVIPHSMFVSDHLTGKTFRATPDPVVGGLPMFARAYMHATGDADYENVFLSGPVVWTQSAAGLSTSVASAILYHWSEADGLSLASWSPTGQPAQGTPAIGAFGVPFPIPNDVSSDGQHYFFTNGSAFSAGTSVFRGELGVQQSINIMTSENPATPNPGTGSFWGASEDGQVAFFVSGQSLVPADNQTGNDLYRWDASQPVGSRLTLISRNLANPGTAVQFGQTLGVGNSGDIVYFSAGQQLVPGEPTDAGQKLYKWERGVGVSFIENIVGNPTTSRVSPDGDYLAFMSASSIDGANTGGVAQAYMYDNSTGQLTCASCPRFTTPIGAVAFEKAPDNGQMNFTRHLRHNVSSNGELFFDTPTRLVEEDTNGVRDAYMYRDGKVYLLSSGRDRLDSFFGDASEDGSSAFFVTYERLTASDIDIERDLYVARVNGGLAIEQEPAKKLCVGDECQGPVPGAPASPERASDEVSGSGNVASVAPLRIAARARRVSSGAVARITVRAPKSGRVVVQGPIIRNVGRNFARPGAKVIRVNLTPRARRSLVRRGVLRTRARVVFRANDGGERAVRQLRLTFRKGGNR